MKVPSTSASLSPEVSPTLTLASVVVPACRSRTNTSRPAPFESFATRLLATDWKATYRPSPESDGEKLTELPCWPPAPTLTRTVVPAASAGAAAATSATMTRGTIRFGRMPHLPPGRAARRRARQGHPAPSSRTLTNERSRRGELLHSARRAGGARVGRDTPRSDRAGVLPPAKRLLRNPKSCRRA